MRCLNVSITVVGNTISVFRLNGGINMLTRPVILSHSKWEYDKMDSKGRIVLPKEVRERLGITPGTEVDINEEDGKAIIEPEDNPE